MVLKNNFLLLSFLGESVSNEIPKANEDPENNENDSLNDSDSETEAEEVANEKPENKIKEKSKIEVVGVAEDPIGSETGDEAEDEAEEDDEGKMFSMLTYAQGMSCEGAGCAHPVPDRRILFKKSLMVLKDPYGSPEVPYTPESQNLLLKKFQIIRYV